MTFGPKQLTLRRDVLVGRARERAVIDALLPDAIHNTSGALVISVAAGIAKSSLLRNTIDRASDFRALHVTGGESEMAFGFAGVAPARPAPRERH